MLYHLELHSLKHPFPTPRSTVFAWLQKCLHVGVFFILPFTVLLFSSFFFFFFLAEMLDTWVPRWLAFLIVFLIMVVTTAILALLGYLRVRKLRAPEKTIESLKQAKNVIPGSHDDAKPSVDFNARRRSEEHTSELQSLLSNLYA